MTEADHVGALRRFNRFYTREIGVLGPSYLEPGLSLTEGRVLYELAQQPSATATDIGGRLGLDPGYLSRILKRFEARGWLEREPVPGDRRAAHLSLSASGRAVYETLDARSEAAADALIRPLARDERDRLAGAMAAIEALMSRHGRTGTPAADGVTLREHRMGDMGWVIERNAILYAAEHGWGPRFETIVAGIVARFLETYDPRSARSFIAERNGERIGCAFVERDGEGDDGGVARLRLLLVEPSARGLGLGRRLVAECIAFARSAGYRRLVLWTQESLTAARILYAEAGFSLVDSFPYDGIGLPLVSETWSLDL